LGLTAAEASRRDCVCDSRGTRRHRRSRGVREVQERVLWFGLYDFRERTLNVVATRLREQKRGADARAFFEKNLERYPKSIVALTGVGQIAAESGDTSAAITYFSRAVEVDPKSDFVRGWLEKLKGPPTGANPPPK
jgi:tetratricopeptide (TPR) repeat protein